MKLLSLPLIALFIFSCGTTREDVATDRKEETVMYKKNEQVIWVNSYTEQCAGVAPMSCLLIQEKENWEADAWKMSYTKIQGFEYKPGYRYKLLVKKTNIDPELVPADGSTIKMELVEIISKEVDTQYFLINDIWALTHIDGEVVKITDTRPSIEVNATELRLLGTGTCNSLNGRIDHLTTSELKFGPIATTRKFCADQEIETTFLLKLNQVSTYQIKDLHLILKDTKGNELLRFKKVD